MLTGAIDEYRRRRHRHQAAYEGLNRSDARVSAARLAVFAIAAVIGVAGWSGMASYWWLLGPTIAFGVLVVLHDRVIRARAESARLIAFYDRGIARIEDRWHGQGEPGEQFRDDHHLYANDLDLFGSGSLFELLSLARTRAGEETLADWLKHPASIEEVRARQEAVRELTPALDLREALSLAGASVRAGVETDALVTWAEDSQRLGPPWLRGMALAITLLTLTATAVMATTGIGGPLLGMVVVQSIFAATRLRQAERVLQAASGRARDLDILAHVLDRLERERFTAPRLAELHQQLHDHAVAASSSIRALHRLIEMHDWQHNVMFAPIGAFLLWGTHLAWAIDAWRRTHGRHVRRWLLVIGEFEAFASLSAYRFEHPDDPFPELVSSPAAQFNGTALGHPLLPAATVVRNDVRLDTSTRLLVVSGSNMSGKSTLLRTVGINAALAQAGAPVRAATLQLTPLAIGATLRIQDSLKEGRSRFYAEITRIREISDLASGPVPLCFLLDELFHGTNSHDRLIGASGVLNALLNRGAIGLVTTHDLALTVVAGRHDTGETTLVNAVNVHFDEWFDDGEMRFDYRMKPGPVTRSNAVALMRAVGLDVAPA